MRRGARLERAARRQSRLEASARQCHFLSNQIPPVNILGEEGLSTIEEHAYTLLREIGMDFVDDQEALVLWREAGADVDGERVRFPDGLIRELCSFAPKQFTYHARNPERTVEIGGNHVVLAPIHGAPFVHDIERGRRYGTIEDCYNFARLAQGSPCLQHAGCIGVEPVDLPLETRHLDIQYGVIRYTDKPYFGIVTSEERSLDSIEMSRIVFGKDFVDRNVVTMACLNSASPLVWDGGMLAPLKAYARHGQALKITPFAMAGASSPVTLAGTLIQIYAEAVAGIAFAQVVRKGTPVIFGNFATPIDMQSGAPTFGGPEAALLQLAAGQLARRLEVPYRSAGCYTSSKVPDAQAAMESTLSILPAVLAGSNMMQGCAGWLEGGLVNSYEKFIQDEELLGAVSVFTRGIAISEEELAMDAFEEVGPANHFLGCAHTQRHFLSAVHRPAIADNNSFEQWEAGGGLDSSQRAHKAWKKRLQEYEPPPIDPAIDEELQAFMTRRMISCKKRVTA